MKRRSGGRSVAKRALTLAALTHQGGAGRPPLELTTFNRSSIIVPRGCFEGGIIPDLTAVDY